MFEEIITAAIQLSGLAAGNTRFMGVNQSNALECAGTDRLAQITSLSTVLSALQSQSPERIALLDHLSAVVGTGIYRVDPYEVGGSVIRESLWVSAGIP